MAEFRILGTVEAYAPAGPVDIGPPRQRTVLAALLIDAGRAVPVSMLVDRIWGDAPPELARRSLHSYIARLRRIVDAISTPQAPARLVRRSGGYQLQVSPEQVDVLRFRALVEQSREAGRSGAEQAALLRDALALWRGEPLTGTSGDWAARLREQLAQQRLGAAVAWARAELRLGNAAALTGPLGDLVAEHPLVEPLATSYLLALRAAGRSAEALRHYETVRRGLADTLGVDPTAELRQAYHTVLRPDPEPSTAAGGPQQEHERVGPVPAMLPPDINGFTGRAAQLAELDRLAGAGGQPGTVVIAALSGTAGIGKTALAVHWAHRVAGRYPDGQLYVNLRGFDPAASPVPPAQAVRILLDALGVPARRIPAEPDAQVGLYRSELAGRRVLVLLDNARDAAQVRPLLPGSPTTTVLVTSRKQLTGLVAAEGARPLTLPMLNTTEAYELLAARLGAARVAAEPDAVRTIVARCARLPLALAVAAARAATYPARPLATLAAELTTASRLDVLAGEDPVTDARAVFGCSYAALSMPAARLFRLIGTCPGQDISFRGAASLAGLPPVQTRPLLAELTTASLLVEHQPDRYAMHDLLRSYAGELFPTGEQHAGNVEYAGVLAARRAAIQRLLDHYLHTAESAARLLDPQRAQLPLPEPSPGALIEPPADAAAALAWFTLERPELVAAVQLAGHSRFDTHAWRLASSLFTLLDEQGRWLDVIASQQTAIAAATRLGDRTAQQRAHEMLGLTHLRLARYPAAHSHLRQAAELAGQLGDRLGQARCEQVLSARYGREADRSAGHLSARPPGG
jgi:DNA-binding SARP family transcriptional activator/tetratricopeptide (TPR) repeat protein